VPVAGTAAPPRCGDGSLQHTGATGASVNAVVYVWLSCGTSGIWSFRVPG
jgi:hypothetical protein